MEISCLNLLHHRAFDARDMTIAAALSWKLCLLKGEGLRRSSRVSLPVLEAPSLSSCSRGGCRASCSSSFAESSSCGKEHCGSSSSVSRRSTTWGDGKNRGRRDWPLGVISSPTAESVHSTSSEVEGNLDQSQKEAGSREKFEWKSHWYAVIPEHDLDKAVPHPFQILGQKVVIWYDRNSADWKTFTDVCPHRLAPLSQGRIDETGCLQCCYHAWSFGGDGSCTRIPQARDEGPEAKAVSQIRATSFPTTVKQGILFIWPDANGEERARRTNPPVTPESISLEGFAKDMFTCVPISVAQFLVNRDQLFLSEFSTRSMEETEHDNIEGLSVVATFRDLDYGWDTGMENLLDPSHVPVAHHNVNGGTLGTRDKAQPLDMDVKITEKGCSALWSMKQLPLQNLVFEAPSRATYIFSINGTLFGTTNSFVTPTGPGKCRIIVENGRTLWRSKVMVSGPEWWQIIPRWWDHQKMLNILDGDESLLHGQERILREATGDQVENWSKVFFMPTAADRFVGGFRQWLNRFGGKGVKWAEGVDSRLPPLIEKSEDLLDRYDSHTRHCLVCSKALANFKLARTVLFIMAGLLVGGAPLLNVWRQRIPVLIVAGLSALLGWRMQVEWIPMFSYKGYDHARIP